MSYDGLTKYDAGVAATYDQDRQDEDHWHAEFAFIENYVAGHSLGDVLDVPVGTGRLLGALSGARRVVGFDVSADMLSHARNAASQLQAERVELMQGDALAMPFRDGEFDTVLCFRLLHLLPSDLVPALLAELGRVCQGTVLLQMYVYPEQTKSGFQHALRRLAKPLVRRLRRGGAPWSHIESFTHSGSFLESAIESARLKIAGRHDLGPYGGSTVSVLELVR